MIARGIPIKVLGGSAAKSQCRGKLLAPDLVPAATQPAATTPSSCRTAQALVRHTGSIVPARRTLPHLLITLHTCPSGVPVAGTHQHNSYTILSCYTIADNSPGADTADTNDNMERRPPSTTRSRIPGGYGNYPGRDPESPPPESSGSGGGGEGRKKRTPAPWGGLFKGKVSFRSAMRFREMLVRGGVLTRGED